MQEVEKVLGHEEVIRHLQNAVAMDQVSHSYIFAGEKGSGKKLLAKLFAMTLQCEKHGKEPCLQCGSCKKAMNRNHPDIIYVSHLKPNSIGIEDIREQLIADVEIKPYTGPYKIYIVDEAEKMTVQAQNALLKTIEEPPAYAVILLLANNNTSLLPTITSRCVTLNFKPVRDDLIKSYLMEELHVPDYQAEVSVAFAQGNVGTVSYTHLDVYKRQGEAGGLCDRQPCFDGERRVYEVCGEWDLFAVWAVEEDLQED